MPSPRRRKVAQAVTGARKGAPGDAAPTRSSQGAPETGLGRGQVATRRFWDALAYTRVLKSPREVMGLQKYLLKNLAETLGLPDPRATFRGESVELAIPRGAGPPLDEVWA
ncbi:MAG: hypothetical protein IT285_03710 [Bdellovibrionales bacterium]|nr:hypothetical protein [Bdellovibrionales bacterium]